MAIQFARPIAALVVIVFAAIAIPAQAQTAVESSSEIRFQLDVQVPDAALTALFPPGFTLSVSNQGPAKDCNLRVVFIDRVAINAPDGKPVGNGSNRVVLLEAPVKDPAGANARLVVGGLTSDPTDAPGIFGNYLHATAATMKRTIIAEGMTVTETQDWVFRAATGEAIEMHITFERGVAQRGRPSETKYYSAKTGKYIVSQEDRMTDIMRNVTTTPPDRVKQFQFKAGGGSYGKLLGGPVKMLSWDNNLFDMRTVSTP